ncbi:hypothetical protein UA08_06184 [Talaromyces atroroseus]|uniref:Uncharacterized protein n=1 Tax=Talaromyces atroroseus TaxID=1441469 RepID=A0A225ADD3_TALAT|nr:hypothetical protein UA08_06184 [Talaromyces atroroseus]OKL58440.1 hypothetical protein UA08_06184 [Talaromyces atroroseus]
MNLDSAAGMQRHGQQDDDEKQYRCSQRTWLRTRDARSIGLMQATLPTTPYHPVSHYGTVDQADDVIFFVSRASYCGLSCAEAESRPRCPSFDSVYDVRWPMSNVLQAKQNNNGKRKTGFAWPAWLATPLRQGSFFQLDWHVQFELRRGLSTVPGSSNYTNMRLETETMSNSLGLVTQATYGPISIFATRFYKTFQNGPKTQEIDSVKRRIADKS